MSIEVDGVLTCKTTASGSNWALSWTLNGKAGGIGHMPVSRLLRGSDILALGGTQPVVTIKVKIVIERNNPIRIILADENAKAQAESVAAAVQARELARQAAKRLQDEERIRSEEERKRAAGTTFSEPGPWKASNRVGHFHNPYNFIPAPEGMPPVSNANNALDDNNSPLGHYAPAGHHKYHEKLWSGKLQVKLTVKTPLLVPDTARKISQDHEHVLLPVLTDRAGNPCIPATSFKGVLRSAYEAITNSRMGVFSDHDAKLGRRMNANEALAMVPARITSDEASLELFMGSHAPATADEWPAKRPQANRKPPNGLMYAAWLPRYNPKGESPAGPVLSDNALRPADNSALVHGAAVKVWLRKVAKPGFSYWRVEEIVSHDSALSPQPPRTLRPGGTHTYVEPPQIMRGSAYVCMTGQNFGRKHDERVFFVPDDRQPFQQTSWVEQFPKWSKDWTNLVEDYQAVHKKELEARARNRQAPDAYMGNSPGKTAFSRHVHTAGAEKLKPGDLCYALVDQQGSIKSLYPVMISRELGDLPPSRFLPDNIRPAKKLTELSPADRVFGWVAQGVSENDRRNMHRGQLRIRSLKFAAAPPAVQGQPALPAIQPFRQMGNGQVGLPLAILGQPKPKQIRFYLGSDKGGRPLENGVDAASIFYSTANAQTGSRLRGRKVYPHHRAAAQTPGYWNGPAAFNNPQQQVGTHQLYREYVRQDPMPKSGLSRRDNQNRSIEGWISPGVTFDAEIDVVNMNEAELGALLWLLNLGDDHFLRMGLGKPLGFGSVNAKIVEIELTTGEGKKTDYMSLKDLTKARLEDVSEIEAKDGAIEAYKKALVKLFGIDGMLDHDALSAAFENIAVIKAFRNAATGIGNLPVHYPRASPADPATPPVPPNRNGENFKWFGANEKEQARRQALDPLWEPVGLTYFAP